MKTGAITDELDPWEAEALIKWFMYRIGQEDRHALMQAMPQVYNKLVAREVMRVTVAKDA